MTDEPKRETHVHRPDEVLPGVRIGHVDNQSRIRERDGVLPGRPLGYVDEAQRVRKPHDVLPGELVGKIKGRAAHAPDGVLPGQKWGYVDEHGAVRLRDGVLRGRIIGRVRGGDVEGALGFFILQFDKLETKYKDLAAEIRQARNKSALLGKVRHMQGYVSRADALGDFDGLIDRLRALESEILGEEARNQQRKEGLCHHAETLTLSMEWKSAADGLKRLHEDWKAVGSAGREQDERLWARFRAAQDGFYERRKAHFAQQDGDRERNRARKEALCVRAEALSTSTEWKSAADSLKALQADWKAIGGAGKDHDEALWARFRGAHDRFFGRRQAHFGQQDEQRQRARSRKEALCARAEALAGASDWKDTANALKALQADWKAAGSAGRDHDEPLWDRFRHAQDRFFQRRSEAFAGREREQQANLARKERLCAEAEALARSGDDRSAMEQVKALQAAWKTIGHVPRESADHLWGRFRNACDRVFEHAHDARAERQAEWTGKMRDALERKREQYERIRGSIEHDLGNIERWRDTIENLRPGPRAYEIASDLASRISDVQERIGSKRERLDDLAEAIRDIQAKL